MKGFVVSVILSFLATTVCILLVSLLWGCTPFMSYAPVNRSVVLEGSQAEVYGKALRAVQSMGGEITHADAQTGTISARVHNAVILNVSLSQADAGTTVNATGRLMPDRIGLGRFDDVDDFIARVR